MPVTVTIYVALTDPQARVVRELQAGGRVDGLSGLVTAAGKRRRCSIDTILALRDKGVLRECRHPSTDGVTQRKEMVLTDLLRHVPL